METPTCTYFRRHYFLIFPSELGTIQLGVKTLVSLNTFINLLPNFFIINISFLFFFKLLIIYTSLNLNMQIRYSLISKSGYFFDLNQHAVCAHKPPQIKRTTNMSSSQGIHHHCLHLYHRYSLFLHQHQGT